MVALTGFEGGPIADTIIRRDARITKIEYLVFSLFFKFLSLRVGALPSNDGVTLANNRSETEF